MLRVPQGDSGVSVRMFSEGKVDTWSMELQRRSPNARSTGDSPCGYKYTASQEPLTWKLDSVAKRKDNVTWPWPVTYQLPSKTMPLCRQTTQWASPRAPEEQGLSTALLPQLPGSLGGADSHLCQEAKANRRWYPLYDAIKGGWPLQNMHQLSALRLLACHSMWSLSVPVD